MFNEEYKNIEGTEEEGKFWRELKVNYDKLEENQITRKQEVADTLTPFPLWDLTTIGKMLGVGIEQGVDHTSLIDLIKEHEKSALLLYLNSMIGRRGKYIGEYYQYRYADEKISYLDSAILVKLLHLYQENHTYLFEITALSEWREKASGEEYFIENSSNENIAEQLLKKDEQEKLCQYLKEHSAKDNHYRVTMYCRSNAEQNIFVIYKMKNDTPLTGFDQTKRIKSVSSILIMIDTESSFAHIKGATPKDSINIISFLKNQYNCNFEKCNQEVIDDYDEKKFKFAFQSLDVLNQQELDKFHITKVGFRKSALNKAPELILGDGKRDVWPAVVDANAMKIIDINSLDSIKSLNICSDKIKRNVKVLRMEDASILYKLDDKGLGEKDIEGVSRKFTSLFGIPLNKRLKNKLEAGYADEVNVILRSDRIDEELLSNKEVLNDLIKDKLITINKVQVAKCSEEQCTFEDVVVDEINICPFCQEGELIRKENVVIKINKRKIEKYILSKLAKALEIMDDCFTESKEKKLEGIAVAYRFVYNKNEYKVVIADKVLSKKKLQRLEKQLVPTIVVYYGIDRQQADVTCIDSIPYVEFGMIYTNREDMGRLGKLLERVIKEIDDSIHYHIISAAKKGNQSLKDLIQGKTELDKNIYNSTDFEDDVYSILKHLFFASDKWGATEIGKALPEGVLTFEWSKNNSRKKKAFSYDCKINYDGKGYELGSGEKRKAMEYVNGFNDTREVQYYCTDEELTAHIFIGNKFKDDQIDLVNKHFKKYISNGKATTPVFVGVEGLISLYDWYRKNYEEIQKNRDTFYEEIHKALSVDNTVIEFTHWQRLIDEMEACFRYSTSMDTKRVKETLLK